MQTALKKGKLLTMSTPLRNNGRDGQRLSRRNGNALEFSEYREYQAGDDLRRLDWRVFARNGQLLVKQFSEEVEPRCELIIDHSASMQVTAAKALATLALAAILTQAADNADYQLTLWQAGEQWQREQHPTSPLEWQNLTFNAKRSPGETLAEVSWQWQRRGIRILLSDLLWPEKPQSFLQRLREGSQLCLVVQVLSTADLHPAAGGQVTLADVESNEEREYLLDDSALTQYQERFQHHLELWQLAAETTGMTLLPIVAEQFLADWDLQAFHQAGILQ